MAELLYERDAAVVALAERSNNMASGSLNSFLSANSACH